MTSLYDLNELTSRIAREEWAAAAAKCERSKRAHLGLAQQYRQKAAQVDAVETSIRISFG